ncbi:MAG: hypothetical protein IJ846_01970 [Alphaproteobacteria bacterium]|nr:hypothetical protein [Alphaproteobacteria bacterium]
MFEAFQDSIRQTAQTIQEKYDGFADSVNKLNQDILEIRDMFVAIKNIVFSIFSFLGQETTVLLFCTFLFLFVINLIPFLFLGKRTRYGIGIGFGVYLSFSFKYAIWSLIKYILVMLFPILVEYLLILFLKTTGKSLWSVMKKGGSGIWNALSGLFRRLLKKTKKNEEDEKQVLKQ